MPTLADYLVQVRRLLKDPNGATYQTSDLTDYINDARQQLAVDGECVRLRWAFDRSQTVTVICTGTQGSQILTGLPSVAGLRIGMLVDGVAGLPIGAQITAIDAVALTVTINTVVTANFITQPASFTPLLSTAVGQEFYSFGTNVFLAAGYQDVLQVKSVAVNWGGTYGSNNLTLENWSERNYSAFLRMYGPNLLGNPAAWSTCSDTLVQMRPIPSAVYPMEWLTVCTPTPLTTDPTSPPEVIPAVWTDAVKFFAAHLAFLYSQRHDDSKKMFDWYELFTKRGRNFKQRTFVPYIYR